jgi:hypothetical protein
MSHAVLANDGLLILTGASALLLAAFIGAVVRMPPDLANAAAQPGGAAQPEPVPAQLPAVAHDPSPRWPVPAAGPAAPLPRRPAGDAGYVARHAARGGPPWGPAPRPPGAGG